MRKAQSSALLGDAGALASGDGAAQKAATTPFDAVVLTTPRALADQDLVSTIGELTDAGFPPERVESAWRLGEAWFHTDQNAASRPGLQTVQSFTSLFDQEPSQL